MLCVNIVLTLNWTIQILLIILNIKLGLNVLCVIKQLAFNKINTINCQVAKKIIVSCVMI